jgi:hypothetical protein
MATRDHVDSDFNALSREVECKLAIYFDETPIEVTSHDYIMQVSISEESSAESTNPLGAVSANELEITLLNQDGIFSPSNASGTYYGKIKTGVKIIPYIRLLDSTDTLNWIQLGVFYVTEWNAVVTALTASVYATDIMKDVLAGDSTDVQVVPSYTFKQFIEYYFSVLGYSMTADASLTDVIPFAYAESDIKGTLSDLACAAKAMCYSDRTGTIVANPVVTTRALRATLTDGDQIVSVSLKQSTLKTYDGVAFTYRYPQLSMNTNILEVDELSIPNGAATFTPISFDKGPVAALSHVAFQTIDELVYISAFAYTPWQVTLTTQNDTGAALDTNLSAYGTLVEFTDIVLSDETDNMLTYSNKYIQTETQAESYKAFLDAFVASDIPTLDVQIRGNLLLELGDKITVQSTKYNLAFTGIIQRAKHTFAGSLSTTLTLINADIMEAS